MSTWRVWIELEHCPLCNVQVVSDCLPEVEVFQNQPSCGDNTDHVSDDFHHIISMTERLCEPLRLLLEDPAVRLDHTPVK